MKVQRKAVNIRNDCFAAEEKDLVVRIESHHHRVWITVENVVSGAMMQADLTLPELAFVLNEAANEEYRK